MLRSRSVLRDRRGNFGVMSALLLPVGLALSAVAVDQGSLYFERRETQALADIAAIAAAADIANASATALDQLQRNGLVAVLVDSIERDAEGRPTRLDGPSLVVETGRYRSDPSVPSGQRFVADASPANAARVTLLRPGSRYFASSLIPPTALVAAATAASDAQARISVGSRLLGLNGGIVNQVLGTLLGAELSLSVMDYEALAGATIDMPILLDAVAEELSLQAATYEDVLAADLTAGRFARALSGRPELDQPARAALAAIAGASAPSPRPVFTLGDLVSTLGRGGLSSSLQLMDLLSAAAVVAGQGRQVSLDLGASLPGLLSAQVALAIGEPPQHASWTAFGGSGTEVRTAQTRLAVTVEIGGILGARIRLPLYLELAFAEAQIADIACPGGRSSSATVDVAARPGIIDAWIGEVAPAQMTAFAASPPVSTAEILKVPLLVTVTGKAAASMSNPSPVSLRFDPQDIAENRIRSVSTTSFTGSLTASLLGNLRLDIRALGLGIGIPGNLTGTIASLLGTATPAIDSLLANVLLALGIRLGEADIRVGSVSCGRSVLVQ